MRVFKDNNLVRECFEITSQLKSKQKFLPPPIRNPEKLFQTRKIFFSSPKRGAISGGAKIELAHHAGFIEMQSQIDHRN